MGYCPDKRGLGRDNDAFAREALRLRLRAEATAEALFCFADVLQLRLWAWFAPSIAEHTACLISCSFLPDDDDDHGEVMRHPCFLV